MSLETYLALALSNPRIIIHDDFPSNTSIDINFYDFTRLFITYTDPCTSSTKIFTQLVGDLIFSFFFSFIL